MPLRQVPHSLLRPLALPRPLLAGALIALILALPVAAAEVVASGTFTKKSFRVNGSWKIVDEGGKLFLEIDQAFSTKNGPDLKFFLSPRTASEVEGRNAAEGSVFLGQIESNRGAQRFAVPPGTDLSRYRSLVLHCEKYSKLWAASPLR
ncbi:MAG: DM13 domain-containing protein [Holophagales bacterium]|nr:DM13 domain-containing protein [Holophagales bacterium]